MDEGNETREKNSIITERWRKRDRGSPNWQINEKRLDEDDGDDRWMKEWKKNEKKLWAGEKRKKRQ